MILRCQNLLCKVFSNISDSFLYKFIRLISGELFFVPISYISFGRLIYRAILKEKSLINSIENPALTTTVNRDCKDQKKTILLRR
jgi:hypothetical protein